MREDVSRLNSIALLGLATGLGGAVVFCLDDDASVSGWLNAFLLGLAVGVRQNHPPLARRRRRRRHHLPAWPHRCRRWSIPPDVTDRDVDPNRDSVWLPCSCR